MLFEFVYPDHRAVIPEWVMDQLWRRTRVRDAVPQNVCRGTLISRQQYLVDVEAWGYHDARAMPQGRMTAQQIRDWTDAIGRNK